MLTRVSSSSVVCLKFPFTSRWFPSRKADWVFYEQEASRVRNKQLSKFKTPSKSHGLRCQHSQQQHRPKLFRKLKHNRRDPVVHLFVTLYIAEMFLEKRETECQNQAHVDARLHLMHFTSTFTFTSSLATVICPFACLDEAFEP